MEAESVDSLTPLIQAADQWGEVLLLLPLLVALEAVLSADNAIALAAISRRLHDPQRQRQALNLGLLLALVFRMLLILAARWVLDAWPLQLLAAGYLLWLCGRHLLGFDEDSDAEDSGAVDASGDGSTGDGSTGDGSAAPALVAAEASAGTDAMGLPPLASALVAAPGQATKPHASHHAGQHGHGATLSGIAVTLALTDLAFSLDSVAAAVAVTDRLALVMAGGVLGVLALRLTAGLFVRWLEVFSRLETAGYLAVGLVGIRLLLRLLLPDLDIPEWLLLLLVASLFLWGFSSRVEVAEGDDQATDGDRAGEAATAPVHPQGPPEAEAAAGPADSELDTAAGRSAESSAGLRAAGLPESSANRSGTDDATTRGDSLTPGPRRSR